MKRIRIGTLLATAGLLTLSLMLSCGKETASEQAETAYQEPHRPQFHFSPPQQWMNDPNGMVYYDGEYHLFYQHYPDSNVWGPMHWGHAVSRNMVDWENLPIALYPDSLGYIFSGSAVVDWNNTSGFGQGDQPPMVAIFTYHDPNGEKAGRIDYQYQAIAYSNDKGRTWTKYAGNPVVPNPDLRDFRDPKVFWYAPGEHWVMILAAFDRVRFYTSPNLKEWTFAGAFGEQYGSHAGVWECPDLFELPVEGADQSRWVLLLSINPGAPLGGSATQYFLGDFDGKTFTIDPQFAEGLGRDPVDTTREKAYWIDFGRDNYAGVTWSDVPAADGRRLFLGWMSNWDYAQVAPTVAWRSAMTLPRTLSLRLIDGRPRLFTNPVRELTSLRTDDGSTLDPADIQGALDLTGKPDATPAALEAVLEFELPQGTTTDFGVELSNSQGERYRIGYDAAKNVFYSDRTQAGKTDFSENFVRQRHEAPRLVSDAKVRFHLFFDVASAELFADDGATVLTDIYFPSEDFSSIRLYAEKGSVRLTSGTLYSLRSIWKK